MAQMCEGATTGNLDNPTGLHVNETCSPKASLMHKELRVGVGEMSMGQALGMELQGRPD